MANLILMRKILFVTLLFSSSFQEVWGQNNFNLTVDHLAISVKDVNRAAQFYGDVLKFQEIKNRSAYEGVRWFSIGHGKELHLISMLKEQVTLSKAIHIAFATPDFDAFVAMLDKMKIPYSDWPGNPGKIHLRADGMKQVFFQDPDGNWIEINSVAQ
jgi:lactoylglutathione lyase